MTAKARSSKGRTQRLATGVGWVSLGMGAAMSLDPRRSAALLGWSDREGLARLVGGVDLILGAGLLRGRRRARWMLARALLNAVIGLIYARVLAEGHPRRRRPAAGAGLLAALTAFDYSLSRRLREAETL